MPVGFTDNYYQSTVVSSQFTRDLRYIPFPMAANQVISEWQIVAQQTGANTDDVQTLTNTATGGTFTLTVGGALTKTTTPLACATLTAAQLQAALNAAYQVLCPGGPATGYVTVTGGPFTSGAGSLTVTFNSGTANTGPLASNGQTLMVINNGAATGGTVTIAHTTTGIAQGGLVPYSGTLIAVPTTAPALTVTGSDGTLAVGAYALAYTYVSASGESIPSYESTIAVASTNHIAVASITGIPTGVVSVNVYLDGLFVKNVAVTSGATGAFTVLAPAAATAATPPPKSSSDFTASDGSQIPIGIAAYAMASGPNGQITYGGSAPTGNNWNYPGYTGNVVVAGWLPAANINAVSAIDQNTLSTLGRLINGSLSNLTNATFAIYGG